LKNPTAPRSCSPLHGPPTPEIKFLQHDLALGLPELECEFDRAVAHMVVVDVEPLDALVRGVGRALRPGGRFALTMPHPCFFNFGFAVSRLFEPAQPEGSGDAQERAFRCSIPVFLFIEAVAIDNNTAY